MRLGKKVAEKIRLIKKHLSLDLAHIEKNLYDCIKILVFVMIGGKLMNKTIKSSKISVYKV